MMVTIMLMMITTRKKRIVKIMQNQKKMNSDRVFFLNWTINFLNLGLPSIEALNGVFQTAFIVGAVISVIATVIAIFGLKIRVRKAIAEN